MNRYLRLLFFTLVFFVLNATLHAQNVTLSNNLLYDATLTPNLRLGVRLSPHWSMGLTGGYRPWPTDENKSRKWKHLLVSPDLRYWTDSVNVHHFFGVNLIYAHFNIANVKFPFGLYKGFRDERRQGDLGALGAYYGYSWPLGISVQPLVIPSSIAMSVAIAVRRLATIPSSLCCPRPD